MKVMIDTLNLEKSIYWIMLYITLTGPSLHNDDTKKQTLVMLSSLFSLLSNCTCNNNGRVNLLLLISPFV